MARRDQQLHFQTSQQRQQTLSDKKIVGHPVFVQKQNRGYSLRPTGKLTKHHAKVEEHGDSYSGPEDAPHLNPKKEQPEIHCSYRHLPHLLTSPLCNLGHTYVDHNLFGFDAHVPF